MPDSSQSHAPDPRNGGQPAPSAASAAEPALEMTDVTIGSLVNTERVVLEDVNWTVRLGDFWAIGGLEASGKTDLLALAACLMKPLAGHYRVFGHELRLGFEHELLEARLSIGLVFEDGRLFQGLTAAENVGLPIRYHQRLTAAEALGHTQALLDLVDLGNHADRLPGSMSRSWQKRVALARALAIRPRVLLLDNPLRAVDPRETHWWVRLLEQLAAGHPTLDRQPITLALTAGDLRPWRRSARQFAILRNKHFLPMADWPRLSGPDELRTLDLLGAELDGTQRHQ